MYRICKNIISIDRISLHKRGLKYLDWYALKAPGQVRPRSKPTWRGILLGHYNDGASKTICFQGTLWPSLELVREGNLLNIQQRGIKDLVRYALKAP
jgi:hypothetical protein